MQSETEYGRFEVTYETRNTGISNRTTYYVKAGDERIEINDGNDGRKLARTLAATLDAAGAIDFSELPPEWEDERPDEYSEGEWESWEADNQSVPVRVAGAGKAPLAGYLKVVYGQRESWIARRLDVSEQTVRQYLSDLREGRR